jgi:hypothetical protein
MSALSPKQSYRGLARIDSRGWQRNYTPNRRIFTYVRPFSPILVRLAMTAIAYLAGPVVFLPNAVAHAATKVEIHVPYCVEAPWRHVHNSRAIASGLMALLMAAFVHESSCASGLEFAAGPRQTRGLPGAARL